MNDVLLDHDIGLSLRYLVGAIAFGIWQNSWAAGIAFWVLIVTSGAQSP